jgi:hypothetical protein
MNALYAQGASTGKADGGTDEDAAGRSCGDARRECLPIRHTRLEDALTFAHVPHTGRLAFQRRLLLFVHAPPKLGSERAPIRFAFAP